MTRALIFGITGQDGSYLAEHLLELGHEVHGVVRRSIGEHLGRVEHLRARVHWHFGDVTDYGSVLAAIESVCPYHVYNLAAISSIPTAHVSPLLTHEVNAVGHLNIIQALYFLDLFAARVLFASSAEIFGEPQYSPQAEFHPLSARNAYGLGKLAAHVAGQMERRRLLVSNVILYPHESPRRSPQFLSAKVVQAALRMRAGDLTPLRLGDLSAVRDWGWAPEFVRVYPRILEMPMARDFVLGTGTATTVEAFCRAAFEEAGIPDWQRHVIVDDREKRAPERFAPIADISAARSLLNWHPQIAGEQVARKMVREALQTAGR